MNEYEALLESVSRLANELQELNKQAVKEYGPEVEGILLSGDRDARHIEHILDGLLNFCGYEPALMLYKKLCRYYFDIDPAATGFYVEAYREMWESDSEGGAR